MISSNNMFCANCGTKLEDRAKFCASCGASTTGDVLSGAKPTDESRKQVTIKCSNCGYEGPGKKGRRVVSQVLIWMAFPFFWPATLFYYLITKSRLCPKCGSDFIGIKNKEGVYKAQRSGTSPVVWVFVVLIIIAVIGILSSVVLASLNTAREKAREASMNTTTSAEFLSQELKQAEAYANSIFDLPAMVDEETRLDRIYASYDNKMNYDYTLINYTADELDWPVLKDTILPDLKNSFCYDSSFEYYRDNNVPMKWNYYGMYKNLIGSIELTGIDCI